MPGISDSIQVLKLNLEGQVTWQYEGRILRRESNAVILEAFFNRADMPFVDVIFKHGDRFVETFYADHWYNIFEIYDRDDQNRKGWYCNVGRPARFGNGTVSYVDLALDLWVSVDGSQTVLDQDEFEALLLAPEERTKCLSALSELQAIFKSKQPPH